MSELQNKTDVEQVKERMRQMQESGKPDPRNDIPREPPKKPATDEKNIRPVKGKPKKKKFGQKLKEAMFSEDIGNGSVTEHIFFKILIPNIKRVLSDMANSAINMALGLDPKTRTIQGSNPHTANASLYRDRNYNRPHTAGEYNRRDAISDIEWGEEDARDIYTQICELIDNYGDCSIADVYSIMGLGDRIRTTDRNWGWTSYRNIDVIPINREEDKWYIDVPPARPIR